MQNSLIVNSVPEGKIELRPAEPDDFSMALRLYLITMEPLTSELMIWDEAKQRASFADQWKINNVQIIGAQNVNAQSRLYEMQYTFHNRPAHALVQVTVSPARSRLKFTCSISGSVSLSMLSILMDDIFKLLSFTCFAEKKL